MRIVRLNKTKYAALALTGEGAAIAGGRWNKEGTRLVYCSTSLSLATLEVLVHTKRIRKLLPKYTVYDVEVGDAAVESLSMGILPPDWMMNESACVQVGEDWIIQQRSVGLLVPSAVTVGEFNVLLNPAHRDFSKTVTIHAERQALFDDRVF